jgi:hypothetical protein
MRVKSSADTNALQILFSTGDVLAQQLVEKRGFDKHDPIRTARMGAYGGGTSQPSQASNPTHTPLSILYALIPRVWCYG